MKVRLALSVAILFATLGCGEDERLGAVLVATRGAAGSGGQAGTGGQTSASFKVQTSVQQLFVTHATPEGEVVVLDSSGAKVQAGTADALGSIIFRKLKPGSGYRVRASATQEEVGPVTVMSVEGSQPPQSHYSQQKLEAGFNYITTRDGTTLAAYVTLPGPVGQGPYPTVVNYSGYSPAKPGEPLGDYAALCEALPILCDAPTDSSALVAGLMGFATVGVNMRGTGCSGGAYDFFETNQLLDGYDLIETIAAQDWVLGNRVAMTGLSYPGISQLFVAKTHPPSLVAITPLSVIGNAYTTMVPGGILNDGFALGWIENVLKKAQPYGQNWEQKRVDAGDTICAENQLLHGQMVDNVQMSLDNPFYTKELVDPLNPTLFASEIDVPVFLAGSWQDEQTGPYFFTLLDRFTKAPVKKLSVYNGVHPDGLAPQVLVEWKSFLDIYLAEQIPNISPLVRTLAPTLFKEIFGVSIDLPPDRFAGYTSFELAKADYEKEASLRVIFENGGASPSGAPIGTHEMSFAGWPVPGVVAERLYFQPDGSLSAAAPAPGAAASQFVLDPAAGQRGILAPGAALWDPLPGYDWKQPAVGSAVIFESAALTVDKVMLGSGSVDLWLSSNVDDADLEVNLSELRPDGQEMYVQSGWLRASHRALSAAATELWPEHAFTKEALQPLVPGQWVEARVGIAAFSHVFRVGSRIRVSVDTPGDSRADWRFRLAEFVGSAVHAVGHSAERPSSVVLPVLAGAAAKTALPPCPSLRAQQCRQSQAYANIPVP